MDFPETDEKKFGTYKDIASVYDKFYSKSPLQYERDVENILILHGDNILKNGLILDFGCGTGRHAEIFLEKTSCKIICFDICKKMIEESQKRLEKKYSGRVKYFSNLSDLSGYKFDIIYSLFFVMNHIVKENDLFLILKKINSCMNNKTSLFIDLYNHELMKFDPPKTYEKITENSARKICEVEKLNGYFKLNYRIYNKSSKLTSELIIKIKSWSNNIFYEIFNNNDFKFFNLDFEEVVNPGYQYVLFGNNFKR